MKLEKCRKRADDAGVCRREVVRLWARAMSWYEDPQISTLGHVDERHDP